MNNLNINSCLVFVAALFFSSCVPLNHVPKPGEVQFTAKGIFSTFYMKDKEIIANGELISMTEDSAIVLGYQTPQIIVIRKADVSNARLQVSLTCDNPGTISTWGGLLWLTSFAHGFYGVLTIPLNIGVGASSASSAANATYDMEYPDNIEWKEMKKFARFPQGIPESVSLDKIK